MHADRSSQKLLTVTIALFGSKFFIPTRLNHPETFLRGSDSFPTEGDSSGDWDSPCVDQMPFESLLDSPDSGSQSGCITDTIQSVKSLHREIAGYVQSFYPDARRDRIEDQYSRNVYPERLTNAFSSAVSLATEAWLVFGSPDIDMRRSVASDPGANLVIPVMSRTGMIIISSLWAVYIGCLLCLAMYSAITPRWTNQLDAFAMMRVGAGTDERIGLEVGFEVTIIDALDELSGVVGDAT